MRTSTVVFDRARFVLGQPVVVDQLAEMAKLDPERTRQLVAHLTATLVAGIAERTNVPGSGPNLVDFSDLGSVATVGPCRSWRPDERLPEADEIGGDRAASYLLGSGRGARVADLAHQCGLAVGTAGLLVARVAPVVASAIADIRSELGLSDVALTEQLGDEHRTLAAFGLVDAPVEPATDMERLAVDTRNVAKIRVNAPYDFNREAPKPVNRSGVFPAWVWWLVVAALAIIVIAVLIARGGSGR